MLLLYQLYCFLHVQVILQCFYMNIYLSIVRYGNALFTNNDNIICCELHKNFYPCTGTKYDVCQCSISKLHEHACL